MQRAALLASLGSPLLLREIGLMFGPQCRPLKKYAPWRTMSRQKSETSTLEGKRNAQIEGLSAQVWGCEVEEVARELKVDPVQGLGVEEARWRLEAYGPNQLREIKSRSVGSILIDQVDDLVIIFLIVTAVISVLLGFWIEGIAVAIVVLINGILGLVMDLRARQSMKALREMEEARSTVVREGIPTSIGAHELVPGDVVLLDEGDVINVDVRLVEANRLQVDEAALTGESLPVEKGIEALDADTPL